MNRPFLDILVDLLKALVAIFSLLADLALGSARKYESLGKD